MKLIFRSCLIVLICCSSKCKKDYCEVSNGHYFIEIGNNSNKTINWRSFENDSIYFIDGGSAASDKIILPNSTTQYGTRNDCWESTFQNNFYQYFFIFDNDTVQALGWQAISGTNRGLLKRVKVDLDYLQADDFKITYP